MGDSEFNLSRRLLSEKEGLPNAPPCGAIFLGFLDIGPQLSASSIWWLRVVDFERKKKETGVKSPEREKGNAVGKLGFEANAFHM
jgi:hypothetical protein